MSKKNNEEKKELVKQEPQDELTIQKIEQTILGGKVGSPTVQAESVDYSKAVKDYEKTGKAMIETMTVVDPISKKIGTYEIDRGGTRDQKLAMVLADPNMTEDRKLSTLSLYLFERGKESASFLTDLMLYKGTQTREVRQFQSTMRFDFTMFVGLFCNFLFENAQTILSTILPGEDVMTVEKEALKFLVDESELYNTKKRKTQPTLREWCEKKFNATRHERTWHDDRDIMMLEMGVRFASEAHHMKGEMEALTQERERALGKPFPGQQ